MSEPKRVGCDLYIQATAALDEEIAAELEIKETEEAKAVALATIKELVNGKTTDRSDGEGSTEQ